MYLYRAIDSVGDTVEFLLGEQRDLLAAKRFMRKALNRHGRPDRIVIDGSQTNQERSSPATAKVDYGIDPRQGSSQSGYAAVNISATESNKTIDASNAVSDQ